MPQLEMLDRVCDDCCTALGPSGLPICKECATERYGADEGGYSREDEDEE